jgi:hypothetical protein
MPKGYHLNAVDTVTTCDVAGFFHQLPSCGTPILQLLSRDIFNFSSPLIEI